MPGVTRNVRVVVAGRRGAGGLSAGGFPRRAGPRPGADFVLLDHSPRPGGTWRFRWPTMTYSAAHRAHDLPGMALEGAEPLRPAAEVAAAGYCAAHERRSGAGAGPSGGRLGGAGGTGRRCGRSRRGRPRWVRQFPVTGRTGRPDKRKSLPITSGNSEVAGVFSAARAAGFAPPGCPPEAPFRRIRPGAATTGGHLAVLRGAGASGVSSGGRLLPPEGMSPLGVVAQIGAIADAVDHY